MDPNDLRPQYDPEETRIDPADGNSYTKQDFIDAYNGTDEWEAAAVQPADPGGAEPGAESGPVAEPEPESELAEVEAEPESEPEPALEPEPEPAEAEAEVGVEAEVEAESEPELAADPEAEPQAELEADLKLASGEEVEPEEAGPGQLDQPDTAEAAGPLRGRGGVSTKAEAERVVESEPEQVRDSEPESELAPGQGPEEVAPAGAADASEIEAMRQSMRKEAAVALEAPDAAAALEATAAVAVETEAAGSIPAPGASAAPQAAAEEAGDGEPLATHAPKDRERSVFGLLQSIVEAVPPSTPRNAHAARYSEISARRIAAVASGRRLAGYPPPPLGSLPTSIVQREPPGSADEAAAAAGGLAVAELEKLSAGELRALLGAMGLTVGGRKRELIGRLRDELDGRVDAPPTALSTPIACGHQRTSPRGARGEGEMALVPTPPSEHRARRPTPPSLLPKSPFSPAARRLGSGGGQVVDAGGGGGGAMGSGGVVGAVLAAAVGQGGRRWDLAAEDEAYDRAWEAMAGRKSAEGAARGCSGESSGNKDTRGGGGGRAGGDTTSRSDRSMDRSAGRNTGRAGPTGQLSSRSLLEQLPAAERRELELLGELSGTIGLGSGEGAEDRVALDREEERRWVGRQEAHRSLGESPQEAGASESGAGGSGVLTVSERTRRQILEDPAMAARYARSRRRRDRKDEELNPAQKLARKMQVRPKRCCSSCRWAMPLPCVSTVFAAKTLPLPCVSTSKSLPLPWRGGIPLLSYSCATFFTFFTLQLRHLLLSATVLCCRRSRTERPAMGTGASSFPDTTATNPASSTLMNFDQPSAGARRYLPRFAAGRMWFHGSCCARMAPYLTDRERIRFAGMCG